MSVTGAAAGPSQLQVDLQNLFANHCHGSNEVEMVANTFRKQAAVNDWIAALTAHFGGKRKVDYASVFCHQRPYAEFTVNGNSCKCELGDVLLVISDHQTHVRRAILLQAKHSATMQHDPSDCQWCLYNDWPEISYTAGKNKRCRQINDKSFTGSPYRDRGQYLLLTSGGPLTACKAALGASPIPFEQICEKMIFDWPSVPISWNQALPVHTEWSHLIWDLLTVTRKQKMPKYGKSTPVAPTRGTALYLATAENLGDPEAFSYMEPADPEDDEETVEPPRGFTIVMIELFKEEEETKDE